MRDNACIGNNTNIFENKNEPLGLVLKTLFWRSQKFNAFASCSIHASRKNENSYKNICNISVWILFVWMFHSRGFNDKINYLPERMLRVTNSDKSSSFQDLLQKK